MSNLKLLLDQLIEAGSNPKETVLKSMQDAEKEAVRCFTIYTPEEIIYAAGYLPVGMWGGSTDLKHADKYLQGFCCSIMRSNIEYGIKGTYSFLKAVVISTFCDTLKCICENWKVAVPEIPVIPVVYPQNRMIEAGKEYLNEEFKRVATELEKLSGKVITEDALNESFEIYEDFRAAMREFTVAVATHLNTIDVKTRHLVIKASFFMDKNCLLY